MTSEDKIKKWLAGELSDAERKEFENSEEFVEINKLLKAVNNFKAPEYSIDGEYKKLSDRLSGNKKTISLYERISPLLKIAAILIAAIIIGYLSYNNFYPDSENREWIMEQAEVYLPDSSYVALNKGSRIWYSFRKWGKIRNVELRGEAFFKVKNGSHFNVKTPQGMVTVLGTEFSVKDWDNYYQVTCYSGSVRVKTSRNSFVLQPNSTFRVVNGKEDAFAISDQSGPDWLHGESSFKSVPLNFVINELERQYKVSVETRDVDLNQLFTGSFSHKNLEIALKSITLPVHLDYEINENKIVITVEGK